MRDQEQKVQEVNGILELRMSNQLFSGKQRHQGAEAKQIYPKYQSSIWPGCNLIQQIGKNWKDKP